jgi:redox-sensitive bicupin YhaK (pirin superfamily)
MAKFLYFPADERGHANHDWLDTYHSFSFANYHNPDKMGFGTLRVFNDDLIQPAMGFGTHSHMNMEIITIPLVGQLEHRDNLGHAQIINSNEVQVMSAGTGIFHSEHNPSEDVSVSLLQLWIIPRSNDLDPRYGLQEFDDSQRLNKFQQVVGPDKKLLKTWINQDAWLYLANVTNGNALVYSLNKPKKNGVFLFVIDGSISVESINLSKRDAIGISDAQSVNIVATENANILVVEIPM